MVIALDAAVGACETVRRVDALQEVAAAPVAQHADDQTGERQEHPGAGQPEHGLPPGTHPLAEERRSAPVDDGAQPRPQALAAGRAHDHFPGPRRDVHLGFAIVAECIPVEGTVEVQTVRQGPLIDGLHAAEQLVSRPVHTVPEGDSAGGRFIDRSQDAAGIGIHAQPGLPYREDVVDRPVEQEAQTDAAGGLLEPRALRRRLGRQAEMGGVQLGEIPKAGGGSQNRKLGVEHDHAGREPECERERQTDAEVSVPKVELARHARQLGRT